MGATPCYNRHLSAEMLPLPYGIATLKVTLLPLPYTWAGPKPGVGAHGRAILRGSGKHTTTQVVILRESGDTHMRHSHTECLLFFYEWSPLPAIILNFTSTAKKVMILAESGMKNTPVCRIVTTPC